MKAKTAKKKYSPQVLNTFNYRGFKIREIFNRKTRRREFKCRFQFNNKEFYLTDERRRNLESIIDETLAQERRAKYELPTVRSFPTLSELFRIHLEKLIKENNRKKISRFRRVSDQLLEIFPPEIKLDQLKKAYFQQYIEQRLGEINPRSGKPILPGTVNKDLSSISVAFESAPLYFPELENKKLIEIPRAEIGKNRRRERLVKPVGELDILLEYLRRPHRNKSVAAARRLLADEMEFKYETGFRRGEVAILKKNQYDRAEAALRNVSRNKTESSTKFFPLSRRAVEIIERRLDSDWDYIFTKTGKPNEGSYRTLKKVCAELNIPYGTYMPDGFVPHDLRHNFATDTIRVTDIETAKNLTGHTGEHILTYLHTDEKRMREAINRREGRELTETLTELYNEIKNGKISLSLFLEKAKILIKNG